MTEVNLLFLQSILPQFTNFNKFLQYEHPLVYIVHECSINFIKVILGNFVEIVFLKGCIEKKDFNWFEEKILDDKNIFITRQRLKSLENDFYTKAVTYLLKNLPLEDVVLQNAGFVDFEKREKTSFQNVEILIEKLGQNLWIKRWEK